MQISRNPDRSLANTVGSNLLELFSKLDTLDTPAICALDRSRFGSAVKRYDDGVCVDVDVVFKTKPILNSSGEGEFHGLRIFNGSNPYRDVFFSDGRLLLKDLPRISRIPNLGLVESKAVLPETTAANDYTITLVLSACLWPRNSNTSEGNRTLIGNAMVAKGYEHDSTGQQIQYKKHINQGADGVVLIKLIGATEHCTLIQDKLNPKQCVPARWFVHAFNPFGQELSTDRAKLVRLVKAEFDDLFEFKSDATEEDFRFVHQARKIDELLGPKQ